MTNRLQRQRFEYKYRTTETKALALRHYIESYLQLDPYGVTQPDRSYPVHSIYLDSRDLHTYNDTINGSRNRYKLRIRYYEKNETSPVYLEIKRRFDKVIAKKRAVVHREAVESLLLGDAPSPDHLVVASAEQLEALEAFCTIRARLDAHPVAHVKYRREAYESSESNSVRVTFDRHVVSEIHKSVSFPTELIHPVDVFGNRVVLELKFTNTYPFWFKELVENFNLLQDSAAKYVDGITRIQTLQRSAHIIG
jgi:hypothetical protein